MHAFVGNDRLLVVTTNMDSGDYDNKTAPDDGTGNIGDGVWDNKRKITIATTTTTTTLATTTKTTIATLVVVRVTIMDLVI